MHEGANTVRLRRMRRMTLAEIADRSRQAAARWVDRFARPPRGGLADFASDSDDVTAVFELFRDAAPRRFYWLTETHTAACVRRGRPTPSGRLALDDIADLLYEPRYSGLAI